MLVMDKIHSIRQIYYEQGKNIPKIITKTGHDRKTITKYLDMTVFNVPEQVVDNNTYFFLLRLSYSFCKCLFLTILHATNPIIAPRIL